MKHYQIVPTISFEVYLGRKGDLRAAGVHVFERGEIISSTGEEAYVGGTVFTQFLVGDRAIWLQCFRLKLEAGYMTELTAEP